MSDSAKGLEGRVALVTGSSRGIGREIALRLARDGADIAVNYRRDIESAEDVVREIEALGLRLRTERIEYREQSALRPGLGDGVAVAIHHKLTFGHGNFPL